MCEPCVSSSALQIKSTTRQNKTKKSWVLDLEFQGYPELCGETCLKKQEKKKKKQTATQI
jgi:hypothetical protein